MNRMLLICTALLFVAGTAHAQNPLEDYVSEVRGDTLVVKNFFEAGAQASTLGAVIQADTDAGNVPEGRVYLLRAGSNGTLESGNPSLYLFDAAIPEQGRPITIVGEFCGLMVQGSDPDCRPPTIAGYQDAAGTAVLATIAVNDDLTMKNVHFTSAHHQGQANWSFIDVNGDNLTVLWENVLAEHNRWIWINSNDNNGLSFSIKDSYLINATDQNSRRNGGVYDNVGQPTDRVWVENTTHLQNAGMQYKFRNFSPSEIVFNHNTFVNAAGQIFLSFGYLTNFVATNNLFVNSNYLPYFPGLDFSEFYPNDTAVEDFLPHGLINLSPLPTDDSGNTYIQSAAAYPESELFAESDRKILVDLNAAYWDEQLLSLPNDLNTAGVGADVCESEGCVTDVAGLEWTTQAILANERTMAMFDDDATYPLMTWGTWYEDGDPNFANAPGRVQELYDWGYASANSGITIAEVLPKVRAEGNEAGNEIDDENPANWILFDWPVVVDLSYTNPTYLAGGYGGFPLGDLNWFPAEKESWLAQSDAEYNAIAAALEAGTAIGTSVEEIGGELPSSIALGQNYPNPFNPTTTIQFELDTSSDVALTVHDVLGRRVATLVNQHLSAGSYEVSWDATSSLSGALSSGIYIYTLRAGDFVQSKQMILMK